MPKSLGELTLDEQLGQLRHDAPGIPRFGIRPHNWWNEGLHGVARAGVATVFPQAIGLAATFDEDLVRHVADVISTEARAKHHEASRQGDHGIYRGLSLWSPNINIFRDPRWGRGQETWGEDPFLTARLGCAFVRGLQGDHPTYLKTIATPKHFAVHSGPEEGRHSFDARASMRDLWETYLPAFRDTIVKAGAASIMAAYNRTNGEACCAHGYLLDTVLRRHWGFRGFVVSDCWAIQDFHLHHKITATAEESAALALRAGCDLNCGCEYYHLKDAHERGLIGRADIERSLARMLHARERLGFFAPAESVPWTSTPFEVVACDDHRRLAYDAAVRSIVLLRNRGGVLPLDAASLKTVAVVGPNADSRAALLGNYHGEPSEYVTVLRGLRAALGPGVRVLTARGCGLIEDSGPSIGSPRRGFSEAVSVAQRADVVVAVLGLDATIEGEQGDAGNSMAGGDRVTMGPTGLQAELFEALVATGKPVVLVLMSGSPIVIPRADEEAAAIVWAGYPGELGGRAIADVLLGRANPGGRLPITFPRSENDLPPFDDYAMAGRTYRYAQAPALYPFGYGLSYARFEHGELAIQHSPTVDDGRLCFAVSVQNRSAVAGDTVVQAYLSTPSARDGGPRHSLVGVRRVTLGPGESRRLAFEVEAEWVASVGDDGARVLLAGEYTLHVGASQPDDVSCALTGARPCSVRFVVRGQSRPLAWAGAPGAIGPTW